MSKYILVAGTLEIGFDFIGPFASSSDASNYGEMRHSSIEWWVHELKTPLSGIDEEEPHSEKPNDDEGEDFG